MYETTTPTEFDRQRIVNELTAAAASMHNELEISMHTVTLRRDNNRVGGRYGQHYYVEAMGTERVKIAYMEDTGTDPYDKCNAQRWARAVARVYGAQFIDKTPPDCLYGWSAD